MHLFSMSNQLMFQTFFRRFSVIKHSSYNVSLIKIGFIHLFNSQKISISIFQFKKAFPFRKNTILHPQRRNVLFFTVDV